MNNEFIEEYLKLMRDLIYFPTNEGRFSEIYDFHLDLFRRTKPFNLFSKKKYLLSDELGFKMNICYNKKFERDNLDIYFNWRDYVKGRYLMYRSKGITGVEHLDDTGRILKGIEIKEAIKNSFKLQPFFLSAKLKDENYEKKIRHYYVYIK